MRIKNIEFRHLDQRPAEIVQWYTDASGKEFCFTLLFYKRNSEGYYIEFVGARPLEYADEELPWDADVAIAKAVAADLLEALEFVIRGVPDTWEGVQKARAAIAKATGVRGD